MVAMRVIGFLALLMFGANRAAAELSPEAPPLIPRADLFGNPNRYSSAISPDGNWLSWLAPYNGVMNLWLAPVRNLEKARPLTRDVKRGLGGAYVWAYDGHHVLFPQDRNGDGNTHIYLADIRGEADARDLTPQDNVRAAIVGVSSATPNEVIISISQGPFQYGDLYKLDLRSGTRTLILKNTGYLSVLLDTHLVPRLAIRREASGDETVIRLSDKTSFMTIPVTDVRTTQLLSMDAKGKTLFLLDTRSRDTAALASIDLRTGKETILAKNDRGDVQNVVFDDRRHQPEFYQVNIARRTHLPLSRRLQADLDFLASQPIGDWEFNGQSKDGRFWKISSFTPQAVTPYLYDRRTRGLRKLYDSRPALSAAPLVDMRALTIKSRDGQDLVSYLSLPPGAITSQDGIPQTPLPMVLLVHGGPHDRDSYWFDPDHQWLANRGYAVLSVNMRGSTGFGKAFLNASAGEWGTKLNDDLLDAVGWAVKTGIADPHHVAIMGGSYGGYAVLRGLSHDSDTYACGVDMYGPSDLLTMQGPGTTYGVSALNHNEVGDPSTAEGQARMKDQSPLYHVDSIQKPLLVAQGANDPAVRPSLQSEPMVAAVKHLGVPVTYLLFPDEGHGFARAANNLAFHAVAEHFFAKCLGGRAEPITAESLNKSSVVIQDGAEEIPGLKEALATREQPAPSISIR